MESIKKQGTSYYVHSAIVLFFMFGFGVLVPEFGKITPVGMKVLGVFLGMLWGWIFVEINWPSMLGIVAFGLTGATTVAASFSSGFGNSMMLNVLLMFLFAGLLNECKITDYIAAKCLSSKIIIGKPWMLIVMFFVADFLISILSSNLAATFILWAAFIKVAEQAGYQKGDKLVSFMICSILYIGVISLMCLPFKTAAIVFCGFLTSGTGLTVPYVPYLVYTTILCFVQIALLLIVGKYILKLDVSKFAGEDDRFAYMRGQKASFEQKAGMVFIGLLITMLFAPALLPADLAVTKLLNNLGIVGVGGILLVIGSIMRKPDGTKLAEIGAICKKGIAWDVILLLVATFPIADAMKSPDCGIMATVSGFVVPLLGDMNPTLFIILCMVVLGITTQFVHNIVLSAMFIPMMANLCMEMGGNPYVLFFAAYLALQAAYVTPGASMQAAMMHGHDWLNRTDGYYWGIVFLMITFVVMIVVGIPLGYMMF